MTSHSTRHIPDLSERIFVRVSPPFVLHSIRQIFRNLFAIHLANPRKRNINASRNPTRREYIPVCNPSRIRHPIYGWACRGRPCPGTLIRSRLPAVQDAGARQDCGARADGDDVLQLQI